MKFIVILVIFIFMLESCGKKSEPQHQGLIKNFTKVI